MNTCSLVWRFEYVRGLRQRRLVTSKVTRVKAPSSPPNTWTLRAEVTVVVLTKCAHKIRLRYNKNIEKVSEGALTIEANYFRKQEKCIQWKKSKNVE